MGRLPELAALFLRLGATAFGGPAAHIAMMHAETVSRRAWLDDRHFLDLVGATNLIPGPNSTEMAAHIGFLQAGWRGLLAAGGCFIAPAVCAVTALAWAYVRFGATPGVEWLLRGIKPAVIAIIAQAIWMLGRKAVRGPLTAAVAAGVVALSFAGTNEIALLLGGGVAVMIAENARRIRGRTLGALFVPPAAFGALSAAFTPCSLRALFFSCLKIGCVWFGSGYVLLAFLQAEFVARTGWITERQLFDAIAVGQVTPGPIFTTVTFIGYLLGGVPGALVATLGIVIPSLLFVAVSNPLIPRMRASPWLAGLLDGVNAASLGLMAAVTWRLGRASLTDPVAVVSSFAAFYLLARFRVNSLWLIMGGALVGLARLAIR